MKAKTTEQATAGKPLPPGPKGRLLSGSLPELREDRLSFLMQLREEYGNVVSFRIGPMNACLVAHPDDILQVLGRNSENYHKSPNYQRLEFLGSQSVLLTEDETWRRQRRMMDPYFRRATLNSFAEMMTRTTTAMLDRWQTE